MGDSGIFFEKVFGDEQFADVVAGPVVLGGWIGECEDDFHFINSNFILIVPIADWRVQTELSVFDNNYNGGGRARGPEQYWVLSSYSS